jgi:hypothetical protein
VSPYSGPPMTLGNAAAARVRLIVWCLDCRHQVEPDPAEMAQRYGAEMSVPDWHKRLVCGQCGGRRVDFVVTGQRLCPPNTDVTASAIYKCHWGSGGGRPRSPGAAQRPTGARCTAFETTPLFCRAGASMTGS